MRLILLPFLLILSSAAYSLDYEIDDPLFTDDPTAISIVDRPYRHLFRKKVFELEAQRITDEIENNNGKIKLMSFIVRDHQGYFVSRYFKKMMYDAYYDDGKVMIYTNRPTPFDD